MGSEAANRESFDIQEAYSRKMGAPITTRVVMAIRDSVDRTTRTGARILDWPGDATADALPLRTVGGLHALAQAGKSAELGALFAGTVSDASEAAAIVGRAFAAHDEALYPWLDGPPQTNEPGRSSALMTGLLAVARRFGQPIELLEIGSSAGLNLLIDRFAFDLGGTRVGPAESPILLRPEWSGPAPAPADIRFAAVRGVDVAPVDVRDPVQAARLRAYVWADNPERQERLDRAIAMIGEKPVALDAGDAADWVEARLAEPQAEGVTRVLMHSVVWQYLGFDRQDRIAAAMHAAGARATPDRPLAWVAMEPVRTLNPRMEVRMRSWPDGGETLVAYAQAHGSWVEGL